MYAPAIVYGFSFRLKKWGSFSICGFEEIVFNEVAWDALVMDPAKKDLLYSLVSEYRFKKGVGENNESQAIGQVDPIANKGQGCIILCYGPPGTRKTLTVESPTKKLHCPLWSLSVSELGTQPNHLEETLVKVLDVVASWGAILLLGEVDIYLECRSSLDLNRIAITGIFLRELEYYRGALFLITNRVLMYDEAFCSRISMFLHFEKHREEKRKRIWKTLLERLGLQVEVDLDDLSVEFSKADFNGREIRNIIQMVVTLAKNKGEALNTFHLRQAWLVLNKSMKELKDNQKTWYSLNAIPS